MLAFASLFAGLPADRPSATLAPAARPAAESHEPLGVTAAAHEEHIATTVALATATHASVLDGDFSLKRDSTAEAAAVAARRRKGQHGATSLLDGDLTLRSATTKGLGSLHMDAASAHEHAMAMTPAGATMLRGDVTLHVRGQPTAQKKKPQGALGSLHLLDGDIMLRANKAQRRAASQQAEQQQQEQQQAMAGSALLAMGPASKLSMLLGDITLHGAANHTTVAARTESEVAASKKHAAAVSRLIKGEVLLGR